MNQLVWVVHGRDGKAVCYTIDKSFTDRIRGLGYTIVEMSAEESQKFLYGKERRPALNFAHDSFKKLE